MLRIPERNDICLFLVPLFVLALSCGRGQSWDARYSLPQEIDRLDSADSLVVFSLKTWYEGSSFGYHTLYRNPVLGSTTITDYLEIAAVTQEIQSGISERQKIDKGLAACFYPRHAVRVYSGRDSLDLMICFECERIEIYFNAEHLSATSTYGDVCQRLNRLLVASEVQLDPEAECEPRGTALDAGTILLEDSLQKRDSR